LKPTTALSGKPSVAITSSLMMVAIARLPKNRDRLVLAGLIALLALSILAARLWSTPPSAGLSRTVAIQMAQDHVDAGATGFLSAEVRHNFNTGLPVAVHRWAWVVTFVGQWHLLCNATGGGCDPTTEWVAIDYVTGEWIASQYSYPAGH
jgi:hypothetical protein